MFSQQYDESENLLNMPMLQKFFSIFYREMDLLFYGVDIIVDAETGVHYCIDCNYISNYDNIEQSELTSALDTMLL